MNSQYFVFFQKWSKEHARLNRGKIHALQKQQSPCGIGFVSRLDLPEAVVHEWVQWQKQHPWNLFGSRDQGFVNGDTEADDIVQVRACLRMTVRDGVAIAVHHIDADDMAHENMVSLRRHVGESHLQRETAERCQRGQCDQR